MIYDICTPILLVDLAGSLCLIVISALCLRESREIVKKEPDNFLYGYMYWLFIALFAFSLSRSLGHIVKHMLISAGLQDYWELLSPVSGSINSSLFLLIASITVFFQKMKSVMERMEQDKSEIERISQQLLKLNKETEMLVSERTRAELALNIAHNIRNPIMVIGGLVRQFLKSSTLTEKQRDKMGLILEQIEKLDDIVREFELVKRKGQQSIEKIDLNVLAKEAVEAANTEALARNVRIEVSYESAPLYVHMDSDLIRFALIQCLKLLLYRLNHSESVRLVLRREKFGALIILLTSTFEDSSKFSELEIDFSDPSSSGKRLGLSTVRQILRDHGGDLHVDGDGSAVKIEIFLPYSIGTAKRWDSGSIDAKQGDISGGENVT